MIHRLPPSPGRPSPPSQPWRPLPAPPLPGAKEGLRQPHRHQFTWRNIGASEQWRRVVEHRRRWKMTSAGSSLASASGGGVPSENAGNHWEPIFDATSPRSHIGDIALFQPDPDILWWATGEANNRNSVGWGDGVWSHRWRETFPAQGAGGDPHQIAKVIPAPHGSGPGLYVAAIGHLWGYFRRPGALPQPGMAARRGRSSPTVLPRTTAAHGATDLLMDPSDPQTLYVAF